MLVLSRGRNDKVVFPTLGISVEILRVAGNKVRLGIEAPTDIPVHRHEVSERISGQSGPASLGTHSASEQDSAKLTHATRNRLNAASLNLHLLHKKVEAGDFCGAEATIFKVLNELKAIECQLEHRGGISMSDIAGTGTDDNRDPLHPRALVVEDDDNERELLAGCLRVGGFDVETAADGLQAMVRLTERAPDVVLLDIRMPRFDGSKTISAIRSNPDYRKLKLFAVTGTRMEETNIRIGPQGVDRWFTKPVNPNVLMEAISEELHTDRVLA